MSTTLQIPEDRFCSPTQPVKHLMKDGVWLDAPEEIAVTTVLPPKWNYDDAGPRKSKEAPKEILTIMGSKPSQWTELFDRLVALPIGGMLGVKVPDGERSATFINRFRSNVAGNTRTKVFKWSVVQSNDKRRALVTKTEP